MWWDQEWSGRRQDQEWPGVRTGSSYVEGAVGVVRTESYEVVGAGVVRAEAGSGEARTVSSDGVKGQIGEVIRSCSMSLSNNSLAIFVDKFHAWRRKVSSRLDKQLVEIQR